MLASKGAGRTITANSTTSESAVTATGRSRSKTSAKIKSAKTAAPGSATGVAANVENWAALWKWAASNFRARQLAARARQIELAVALELEKRRSRKAIRLARKLLNK